MSGPGGPGAVFVYGTLLPGAEAWWRLEPYAHSVRSCSVVGELYDTGLGYPAAVFDPGRLGHGGRPIPGAVVELVRGSAVRALTELDEYEDVPSGMYRRIEVGCRCATRVWVWEWLLGVERLERIDRWSTGAP